MDQLLSIGLLPQFLCTIVDGLGPQSIDTRPHRRNRDIMRNRTSPGAKETKKLSLTFALPLDMTNDVTRILKELEDGNSQAAQELLPIVYRELHQLATAKMRQERGDHTLQPTALVHEAFLRLVGDIDLNRWEGRAHFFGAAAEAMRRILIDHARQKNAAKRGKNLNRIDLDNVLAVDDSKLDSLLELDSALAKLAQVDPDLVKIVELRFFAGLSVEQTAEALHISDRTVKRHWAYARAWLQRELDGPT
jgi:RNA polymerase sigma factor (TIGR02999 family)